MKTYGLYKVTFLDPARFEEPYIFHDDDEAIACLQKAMSVPYALWSCGCFSYQDHSYHTCNERLIYWSSGTPQEV